MKLILAVSGGVDSVVLLDLIARQNEMMSLGLDLIVAHFDHGIRADSAADARFVAGLADTYECRFETERAELGPRANEAEARKVRWKFLHRIREKYDALAIMTAHHADDVFETQIINMLRGTGRRGISALGNNNDIIRPLRHVTKQEIYDYTLKNKLEFVQDETNTDRRFLRNTVRQVTIPKLRPAHRQLQKLFRKIETLNPEINRLISGLYEEISEQSPKQISIPRDVIRQLPETVVRELCRHALDHTNVVHDKQKVSGVLVEQLANFAMRPDSNKRLDISKQLQAELTRDKLVIHIRTRG